MRGTEPLVAKRDPERPASLLNPIEPPCTDPYARWCDRESPRGPTYVDCAEHVWQLGGASPPPNLMEVKGKRLARASPRGGV